MAPCPVLTVGPKTLETSSVDVQLGHILYPGSSSRRCVPRPTLSLAEEYHAKLTYMKAFEETVPSPEEKAQIQEPVDTGG